MHQFLHFGDFFWNKYLKANRKWLGCNIKLLLWFCVRRSSPLCPWRSGSRMRFFLGRSWWWLNLKTFPGRLHNALKDRVTNVDGIVTQTISRPRTLDIVDRSKTNGDVTLRVRPCAREFIAPGKTSFVFPFFYLATGPWRIVKNLRRG